MICEKINKNIFTLFSYIYNLNSSSLSLSSFLIKINDIFKTLTLEKNC